MRSLIAIERDQDLAFLSKRESDFAKVMRASVLVFGTLVELDNGKKKQAAEQVAAAAASAGSADAAAAPAANSSSDAAAPREVVRLAAGRLTRSKDTLLKWELHLGYHALDDMISRGNGRRNGSNAVARVPSALDALSRPLIGPGDDQEMSTMRPEDDESLAIVSVGRYEKKLVLEQLSNFAKSPRDIVHARLSPSRRFLFVECAAASSSSKKTSAGGDASADDARILLFDLQNLAAHPAPAVVDDAGMDLFSVVEPTEIFSAIFLAKFVADPAAKEVAALITESAEALVRAEEEFDACSQQVRDHIMAKYENGAFLVPVRDEKKSGSDASSPTGAGAGAGAGGRDAAQRPLHETLRAFDEESLPQRRNPLLFGGGGDAPASTAINNATNNNSDDAAVVPRGPRNPRGPQQQQRGPASGSLLHSQSAQRANEAPASSRRPDTLSQRFVKLSTSLQDLISRRRIAGQKLVFAASRAKTLVYLLLGENEASDSSQQQQHKQQNPTIAELQYLQLGRYVAQPEAHERLSAAAHVFLSVFRAQQERSKNGAARVIDLSDEAWRQFVLVFGSEAGSEAFYNAPVEALPESVTQAASAPAAKKSAESAASFLPPMPSPMPGAIEAWRRRECLSELQQQQQGGSAASSPTFWSRDLPHVWSWRTLPAISTDALVSFYRNHAPPILSVAATVAALEHSLLGLRASYATTRVASIRAEACSAEMFPPDYERRLLDTEQLLQHLAKKESQAATAHHARAEAARLSSSYNPIQAKKLEQEAAVLHRELVRVQEQRAHVERTALTPLLRLRPELSVMIDAGGKKPVTAAAQPPVQQPEKKEQQQQRQQQLPLRNAADRDHDNRKDNDDDDDDDDLLGHGPVSTAAAHTAMTILSIEDTSDL